MTSYDSILKEYAEELGVESLSMDMLVGSHRTLRAAMQRSEAERRAEMQAAREHATAAATAEVKEQGWFSIERLREMTLGELTEVMRLD